VQVRSLLRTSTVVSVDRQWDDGAVHRSIVWAWFLTTVVVLLTAFALVLNVLAGSQAEPWWQNALGFAAVLASLAMGLLIAARRPGHPIGWLLLAHATLLATFGVAQPYAQYALQESRARRGRRGGARALPGR
jgi:hypothetical protein